MFLEKNCHRLAAVRIGTSTELCSGERFFHRFGTSKRKLSGGRVERWDDEIYMCIYVYGNPPRRVLPFLLFYVVFRWF